MNKAHILAALRAWVNQRPGLEFGNYGEVKAYRSELRSITKDRAQALELIRAVEWRDSITAEMLLASFPRAYSGRLSITQDAKGRAVLDYCTGQYWPTEYRRAACAVLASVLWDYFRENMPKPTGKIKKTIGFGTFAHESEHDNINGQTPGDYLRGTARKEFGRSIASRWFS